MDSFIKAVVQVDFPAEALSMHKQNSLSITNGNNSTETAPSPYFFLLLMFILWISMYLQCLMKFHHCMCKILEKPICTMYKQNSLRMTKSNNSLRIGPYPYFSIINIHLVDINVFAEIPPWPVQDIKEKPNCCGWKYGQTDNMKTAYPLLPLPQTMLMCVWGGGGKGGRYNNATNQTAPMS